MSPRITMITEAARAGGEVLKKYFGQSLETTQKTTAADVRTRADMESEEAIVEVLTTRFPQYTIYSEERGRIQKDSRFSFAIDPLDGTNNFVLGIPNFSISIGLLEEREVVAGVIHTPLSNGIYWAEEGVGAYRDGVRLSVNQEARIRNATICSSRGYDTPFQRELDMISELYAQEAKRVMTNWSPAFDLCLLASGKIEAMVSMGNDLYDFAAGKIIAKEAGATITDLNGNEERDDNQLFIASNGTEIHARLVDIIDV